MRLACGSSLQANNRAGRYLLQSLTRSSHHSIIQSLYSHRIFRWGKRMPHRQQSAHLFHGVRRQVESSIAKDLIWNSPPEGHFAKAFDTCSLPMLINGMTSGYLVGTSSIVSIYQLPELAVGLNRPIISIDTLFDGASIADSAPGGACLLCLKESFAGIHSRNECTS